MNKPSLTNSKRVITNKNIKVISNKKSISQVVRKTEIIYPELKCELCMFEQKPKNNNKTNLSFIHDNNLEFLVENKNESTIKKEQFELQINSKDHLTKSVTLVNNNYSFKNGEDNIYFNNKDGGKVNLFNYKYCKPPHQKESITSTNPNIESIENESDLNYSAQMKRNKRKNKKLGWNDKLTECKTVDYFYTGFPSVNKDDEYINNHESTNPNCYTHNSTYQEIVNKIKSPQKKNVDYNKQNCLFTSNDFEIHGIEDSHKKKLKLSPFPKNQSTITKEKRTVLKSSNSTLNKNIYSNNQNLLNGLNNNTKQIYLVKSSIPLSLYKSPKFQSINANKSKKKSYMFDYNDNYSQLINVKNGNNHSKRNTTPSFLESNDTKILFQRNKKKKQMYSSFSFVDKVSKCNKTEIFDLTTRYKSHKNDINGKMNSFLKRNDSQGYKSNYKLTFSPSFIYPPNKFSVTEEILLLTKKCI